MSIIVVNHLVASSACWCDTFNLFQILPTIVLHFQFFGCNHPVLLGLLRRHQTSSAHFSKLRSEVSAPASLAIDSM
jgi:hypothetical protein